jgi:methionyl aminopeptidase
LKELLIISGVRYHADVNATYFVGQVDAESRKLVETTRACLDRAIEMCRPGALYRDIGNVISQVANKQGFSVVKSYCGHGIGELFHTVPNIPHYAKNKAKGVMRPGHIFTIEPMINVGIWRDKLWPDDWTSVTQDGKRSAQFEETLLITEDGVEVSTILFLTNIFQPSDF